MDKLSTEDYNNIPVHFCTRCLSLNVLSIGDQDFCEDCGCTMIDEGHIELWERLYKKKYGHKLIRDKRNGRKEETRAAED